MRSDSPLTAPVGYKFVPWANNIVVSPFASFEFLHAPVQPHIPRRQLPRNHGQFYGHGRRQGRAAARYGTLALWHRWRERPQRDAQHQLHPGGKLDERERARRDGRRRRRLAAKFPARLWPADVVVPQISAHMVAVRELQYACSLTIL